MNKRFTRTEQESYCSDKECLAAVLWLNSQCSYEMTTYDLMYQCFRGDEHSEHSKSSTTDSLLNGLLLRLRSCETPMEIFISLRSLENILSCKSLEFLACSLKRFSFSRMLAESLCDNLMILINKSNCLYQEKSIIICLNCMLILFGQHIMYSTAFNRCLREDTLNKIVSCTNSEDLIRRLCLISITAECYLDSSQENVIMLFFFKHTEYMTKKNLSDIFTAFEFQIVKAVESPELLDTAMERLYSLPVVRNHDVLGMIMNIYLEAINVSSLHYTFELENIVRDDVWQQAMKYEAIHMNEHAMKLDFLITVVNIQPLLIQDQPIPFYNVISSNVKLMHGADTLVFYMLTAGKLTASLSNIVLKKYKVDFGIMGSVLPKYVKTLPPSCQIKDDWGEYSAEEQSMLVKAFVQTTDAFFKIDLGKVIPGKLPELVMSYMCNVEMLKRGNRDKLAPLRKRNYARNFNRILQGSPSDIVVSAILACMVQLQADPGLNNEFLAAKTMSELEKLKFFPEYSITSIASLTEYLKNEIVNGGENVDSFDRVAAS